MNYFNLKSGFTINSYMTFCVNEDIEEHTTHIHVVRFD